MLTLFLVFIITKGALTLYEGNTIGRGAIRGGDTAQYLHCREVSGNPQSTIHLKMLITFSYHNYTSSYDEVQNVSGAESGLYCGLN